MADERSKPAPGYDVFWAGNMWVASACLPEHSGTYEGAVKCTWKHAGAVRKSLPVTGYERKLRDQLAKELTDATEERDALRAEVERLKKRSEPKDGA